jgi:copper(I)-binding protein
LEGLTQSLQPGQTFPVTLTFANAGPVTTTATVQKAGGGMAMDHGSMGGGGSQSAAMPGTTAGSAPKQ